MNDTSKKAGYLKGLLDSMVLDEAKPGDKLLKGIVDLLGNLCDRADEVDELLDDLNDYVESIDDDLTALESESDGRDFRLFDDEEDEDFDDEDDDDVDFTEDQLHILRPERHEVEEEALAGVLCPQCKRMFFVSLNDPEGSEYVCPHCALTISPEPLTPENTPVVRPVGSDHDVLKF